MSEIRWVWKGAVSYAEAWERQKQRRAAIIAGEEPEVIWLLEHVPPVITTGRRPVPNLPSSEALASRGIDLFRTERGGLATWHGPGQLIAYLMIRARARGLGVRKMVFAIEEAIIEWLEPHGVEAYRRSKHPGIWADGNKICAIGLHFERGVSIHGLALNLCPDLAQFGHIRPCGIEDAGVTSLASLTGKHIAASRAAPTIGAALAQKLSTPG